MKKAINHTIFLWLMFLCIVSQNACSLHHRNGGDVIQFVENPENGLRKMVTVSPCVFTFQYKPAAYILSMEHHRDQAMVKSRLPDFDSMVWFNVTIQISGYNETPLKYLAQSVAEYQDRLNYYLNDARRDFDLICGAESLPASSYWFEDNQGLTPMVTMVVGFKFQKSATVQNDLQIAYYDRVFRSGIIKTRIEFKDIQDIPDFE